MTSELTHLFTDPPSQQNSFVFEVTNACNHDCPHCYNVWKNPVDYPTGQLETPATLDLLERMLDQTGARLVSLSGGEPLLRPDIFEIVDFLHGRGVSINLITNGSLLEEHVIARLLSDRVSVFELPLLSADAETHDNLSGVAGAFHRVTMAIARLKAARQRVVGVFVATRHNLQTWRDTAELAVALGVDGLLFNRFNPGGRGRDHVEWLQASPEELEAALQVADHISRAYDLPIACSVAMPPCLIDVRRYPRLSFGFCAAGTDAAYYTLDPLGNIRPCNHSPRILGNIRTTPFAEIIRSTAMREFMAGRPPVCTGCDFASQCQGGCKAAAEACFSSVQQADPFLRAFTPQPIRTRFANTIHDIPSLT